MATKLHADAARLKADANIDNALAKMTEVAATNADSQTKVGSLEVQVAKIDAKLVAADDKLDRILAALSTREPL